MPAVVPSPGQATVTPRDTPRVFGELAAGRPDGGRARKPRAAGGSLRWWLLGGAAVAFTGIVALGLSAWLLAAVLFRGKTQTPHGTVLLTLDPADAEVLVDGKRWFQRPGSKDALRLELSEGEHDLKVSKNGFDPYTRQLTVRAGQSDSLDVRLDHDTFVSLFNGKDLKGWMTWGGTTGDWKVENGLLVGSGATSHLFSERGDYQNFHFRVEVMINDSGTSGQYFRAQYGPGYPKGYEAQISGTDLDPIKTGSLIPVFDPKLSTEEKAKLVVTKPRHKPGEWFTQEVIADANHITIKVNGETTVDFIDSNNSYTKGHLALQQHDVKTVVKFRKMEIKELLPTLVVPPPPGGYVPLFNGKDLKGWRTHPSQRGNWRVVNGVLTGSGPEDSYLYTDEDDFTDFDLRVVTRINDGGNSGVFFRSPFGPALPPNAKRFPTGYEAQINSTHIDVSRTGSLSAAGGWVVSVRDSPVPPGQWFTLELIAQGNHITIKLNGKVTADWTDAKSQFSRGTLALQVYTAQTVAEFSKIEVKKLPPQKPPPGK
jgi:hypothetical protein